MISLRALSLILCLSIFAGGAAADERRIPEIKIQICPDAPFCVDVAGQRRELSPRSVEGTGYRVLGRVIDSKYSGLLVRAEVAGRAHLVIIGPAPFSADLAAVAYDSEPIDPELTPAERKATGDLVTNTLLRGYLTATDDGQVKAIANEIIKTLAAAADTDDARVGAELKRDLDAVTGAGLYKSTSRYRMEALAFKVNRCLKSDQSTFRTPANVIAMLTFGALKTYRFSRCIPGDWHFESEAVARAVEAIAVDLRRRRI